MFHLRMEDKGADDAVTAGRNDKLPALHLIQPLEVVVVGTLSSGTIVGIEPARR